jgi:F0F1-type ATP synthase membrane subunit b/b'
MDAFAPVEKRTPDTQAIVQRLAAATRKAEDLTRRKATVEARLDEARKTYKRLADAAREKYGTDDLATLEQKLREMEEENARKVEQFEADLSRAEQQIAEAERVLRQS